MLCINNPNDISKMMEYVRTSDMINLSTYFPKLSPVRNLTIIKDIEDYEQNYEIIKNTFFKRCDNLKGRQMINLETVGGVEENIPLLQNIKEIDRAGVLLLFDLNTPNVRRYEYDGGMAVAVDLCKCVRIETVGKGFDGREVSKGITVHERFYIPWNDLRNVSLGTLKNYREYLVSQEKYQFDYQERMEYLMSKGTDQETVLRYIPKEYREVSDFTWKMLFLDMMNKLEEMEKELRSAGMCNFVVHGNIIDNVFEPWPMYDNNRFRFTKEKY